MIFKGLVGLVVLAMSVFIGHPAEAATFPGQNGRVVFTKTNGEVWSVNADGPQARRLPLHNAQDMAWSPDGTQLAFVEPRDNGATRLRILDVRSGVVRNMTYHPEAAESAPAWSYDGSQVGFVRSKQGRSAVFAVKAAGGTEKNVSGWSRDVSYRSPSWAPDNQRMVYEAFSDSTARLLVKDLRGGVIRELVQLSDVTASAKAAWSPNSKKILFNDSDGQVYTIWADGTHRSVISDGDSYDAMWSPDGSSIVFLEDFSGESISVSGSDGSISYVPLALSGYSGVRSPVWSPDGTKLLLVGTKTGSTQKDLLSITVNDTSNVTMVAQNVTGVAAWQARP